MEINLVLFVVIFMAISFTLLLKKDKIANTKLFAVSGILLLSNILLFIAGLLSPGMIRFLLIIQLLIHTVTILLYLISIGLFGKRKA